MLSARVDGEWRLVTGSLLTVPRAIAFASWRRWNAEQPPPRGYLDATKGLDPGPHFSVEPFMDVRADRVVVRPHEWQAVVDRLIAGEIAAAAGRVIVGCEAWSPTVLIAPHGPARQREAISGLRRPVEGVVGRLAAPRLPHSEMSWALALPTHVPRGPHLGRMSAERTLLFWPHELLGIGWHGDPDHPPDPSFVVGRLQLRAWIADVAPEFEDDQIRLVLGWDENQIDPLSCSVVLRTERDGMPLLTSQLRIADYPTTVGDGQSEPRHVSWQLRLLNVRIPRGPRRTNWGISLMAPNGTLLDERPVAPRVESVSIGIDIGDAHPTTVVTGDTRQALPDYEHDIAVRAAVQHDASARRAAAERRVSTTGELAAYLCARFAFRAGELLILDPYVLRESSLATAMPLLESLGRDIRLMSKSVGPLAASALAASAANIIAHPLPGSQELLHDRVWIVGDTALLVGSSVNTFVRPADSRRPMPTTTVAELPYADGQLWRERFEKWWSLT